MKIEDVTKYFFSRTILARKTSLIAAISSSVLYILSISIATFRSCSCADSREGNWRRDCVWRKEDFFCRFSLLVPLSLPFALFSRGAALRSLFRSPWRRATINPSRRGSSSSFLQLRREACDLLVSIFLSYSFSLLTVPSACSTREHHKRGSLAILSRCTAFGLALQALLSVRSSSASAADRSFSTPVAPASRVVCACCCSLVHLSPSLSLSLSISFSHSSYARVLLLFLHLFPSSSSPLLFLFFRRVLLLDFAHRRHRRAGRKSLREAMSATATEQPAVNHVHWLTGLRRVSQTGGSDHIQNRFTFVGTSMTLLNSLHRRTHTNADYMRFFFLCIILSYSLSGLIVELVRRSFSDLHSTTVYGPTCHISRLCLVDIQRVRGYALCWRIEEETRSSGDARRREWGARQQTSQTYKL